MLLSRLTQLSRFRACLMVALLQVVLISGRVHAENFNAVTLRALDKVTARTSVISIPLGETVKVGSLLVTPRLCERRPIEEATESAAFLQIKEMKDGEKETMIFSGWMFASSPGLSALEHPVYDLWLLDCANNSPTAVDQSQGSTSR